MTVNISNVTVQSPEGKGKALSDYKGKVLLIVNVASKCGFTKQYSGLQAIQNKFESDGFQVLGFPCNDFGGQEPGSINEIKEFCSTEYGANFPIFSKVHAKGNTTEPYTTLNKAEPAGDVEWNFEKFLISKDGEVVQRFKSNVEPNSQELITSIEKALKN